MSFDDARHAALMTILENEGNVAPETMFNLVNYESFTGLPRNDVTTLSEPEYLSVTHLNAKYMETLVTPAIPGIAIAVLLFLVCFLVVFLRVCTKCCAMCCPGSCWDRNCFRPQEYNDRKLKITKWAMLIFCIIGGIGCMLVFSQGTELSKGVSDFADELVNTTQSFENIVVGWINTNQDITGESSSNLEELHTYGNYISGEVIKVNSDIKNVADKIELSFMIAAGVIFAVAIIATVFVCLGWSSVLMLFFFTLSLVMIVCWIVFGALGSVGTLLDDVSLGFEAFAADPTIKNAFPIDGSLCPKRYDAVVSINDNLRSRIYDVVDDLVKYGLNPNYCPNCDPISHVYRKVEVPEYCEWYKTKNDKSDISYADPVCRNHYFDVKKYVDNVVNDAYIPKTIGANEIDPTLGGGQFTQCDHTSIDIQNGSTCGRNEVASDAYDEFETYFDILSKWIDLADSLTGFATCEFVRSETVDINATLTTVVDALKILWGGFLMLGMSYFSLWVILLVAVSRLANPQLNVDSDEYDPMWAEKLSMPRER
jgi:hypothetical protein